MKLEKSTKYGRAMNKARHLCLTGIGNPEPSYKGTRHNVGLTVLDLLIKQLVPRDQHVFRREGKVHVLRTPTITFIRSDIGFMNLSGRSVVPMWQKLYTNHTDYAVIHDELSLRTGALQLRQPQASLRGHNGLRDISAHWRHQYYKLAIGIDRPESRDPQAVADYVLSKVPQRDATYIENTTTSKALELLQRQFPYI